MAGYVIAEVDVTDPEKFEVYRGQVGATIEKYGGKYVVRGGATETAEGSWQHKRLIIREFESGARERERSHAAEDTGQMQGCNEAANTHVVFVEGD